MQRERTVVHVSSGSFILLLAHHIETCNEWLINESWGGSLLFNKQENIVLAHRHMKMRFDSRDYTTAVLSRDS